MKAQYADFASPVEKNRVVFLNASGQKIARDFDSPYLARKFATKIHHSRTCRLVSYPKWD